MTGADVIILQNLLLRTSTTPKPPLSNYYDQQTAAAVSAYQSSIQVRQDVNCFNHVMHASDYSAPYSLSDVCSYQPRARWTR